MASPQLPMPTPTVPKKPLLSFKLLSFDIYGTLIDWETSIVAALQPLLSRLPASHRLVDSHAAVAALYNDHEHALQTEQPTLRYDLLLKEIYLRIAKELDAQPSSATDGGGALEREATAFGNSVGTWMPFPDTVDACVRLARHFKLVPLSNCDRGSFEKTLAGPLRDVPFWRYYLAEDIGSYKPDLRNFEYLLAHVKDEGGVESGEVLHTAQSLMHDHVPAKTMGISSAWIARKGAGMGGAVDGMHEREEVGYGWRWASLGEMADAVDKEAAESGKV